MKPIRIEPDVYELLVAMAKEDDRSVQATVNRFLRTHLTGSPTKKAAK